MIKPVRCAVIGLMLLLFFLQPLTAQVTSHLVLQTPYPAPGTFLSAVYNPAGTMLAGKKHLDATVYYWVDKTYYANNTELKPFGNKFKFEVFVPKAARVILFVFTDGTVIDNNNNQGYITLIYQNKKPVAGAYASQATIYSGTGTIAGRIKVDADKAIALFEKEFAAHPSHDNELKLYYYDLLVETKKPGARQKVEQEVAVLSKTGVEKDLIAATNYLSLIGRTVSADSLKQVIRIKYPNGKLVRDELFMSFLQDKETSQKQQKFDLIEKRFPERYNTEVSNFYDGVRLQLAKAYLDDGDYVRYQKYFDLIANKTGLDESIDEAALKLADAGHGLDRAEKLSKQALGIVAYTLNNPFDSKPPNLSVKQWQNNQQQVYLSYTDTYAFVLYRQGRIKEAVNYIQPPFNTLGNSNLKIAGHYALIMAAAGDAQKAVPVIEAIIRQGKRTDALLGALKKCYISIKGSEVGYDAYLASLNAARQNGLNSDMARQMLYKPAPNFTLKDVDGNTVTLTDFKGKVVLLYFWATSNPACQSAMPGMQAALDKYKTNPDVKILLIDTWENGTNFTDDVKKYFAAQKLSINSLVDEAGPDGKQNMVASAYHIEGLPDKILVDKQGNVRFIHAGFAGTPDAFVDEVSGMIDEALKSK